MQYHTPLLILYTAVKLPTPTIIVNLNGANHHIKSPLYKRAEYGPTSYTLLGTKGTTQQACSEKVIPAIWISIKSQTAIYSHSFLAYNARACLPDVCLVPNSVWHPLNLSLGL